MIREALFLIKYCNFYGSDNTYQIDLAKGEILSGFRISNSSLVIPSWSNMLPKLEGSIWAYVGGVSPIIFIRLLEPEPEDSRSQIVLEGDAWTDKLGFV